jgi:hypothetical protein
LPRSQLDRREALNEVRRGINRALPAGYEEGIQFGSILKTADIDQLVILCKVWSRVLALAAFVFVALHSERTSLKDVAPSMDQ